MIIFEPPLLLRQVRKCLAALKNQGYSLIGEYPVNETAILYQYELDETKRAQDSDPHLISVSIDSNQDIIEYCGVGAGFKRKKRNKNV